MGRSSRHRVFLYGVVRLSFLAASLLDDAQQLAEFVFANNPGCSFRNAKSGELFDLAKCHGVCLRRRFGQQFNAELAAGARWVATPMRLAELMDSGGHGLEQAFGLNIDLVHNPFDVAIFDLAERHGKRIAVRLLFALPEFVHLVLQLRLLQDNQVHQEQLLEAVYFRAAAILANIATCIRFDVVCSLTAGEAEAGIVVLETPIFLFGENRLEERFAIARVKRLCGHSVEEFLYVLLDRDWPSEGSQGRSEAECHSPLTPELKSPEQAGHGDFG